MLKPQQLHVEGAGLADGGDEVKAPDGGPTTSSSMLSERPSSGSLNDLESGRCVFHMKKIIGRRGRSVPWLGPSGGLPTGPAEAMCGRLPGSPKSVTHDPPIHVYLPNTTNLHSLASGSIETVDSGAPQSYTWRDVRCSYEQRSSARGSKPVEVEVCAS